MSSNHHEIRSVGNSLVCVCGLGRVKFDVRKSSLSAKRDRTPRQSIRLQHNKFVCIVVGRTFTQPTEKNRKHGKLFGNFISVTGGPQKSTEKINAEVKVRKKTTLHRLCI